MGLTSQLLPTQLSASALRTTQMFVVACSRTWCGVGGAGGDSGVGLNASGAGKRVRVATEEGAGRPRSIDAASSSSRLGDEKSNQIPWADSPKYRNAD